MSGKTVTTACEDCKKNFERSVFNPYMKSCPECRGVKSRAPKPRVTGSGLKSAFAAQMLAMVDKGNYGNLANTDFYAYKQKNGELYVRVGSRKFFSRKAFMGAFGLQ